MAHPHRPILLLKTLGVALLCMVMLTMPRVLFAQDTPTPPAPTDPILPAKPTTTPTPEPKVEFELVSYYTDPQQLYAQEPFDLHLEFVNKGTIPANGWSVSPLDCYDKEKKIISDGLCSVALPSMDVGQSGRAVLHLRYLTTEPKALDQLGEIILKFEGPPNIPSAPAPPRLVFLFLPSRTISDPQPTLARPFPEPNINVKRTWIAKARSTVEELLTPEPLRIDALPYNTSGTGGPEFELVVEIQNQGVVDATNLFIDFCTPAGQFNPVGSTCRKQVPTTLAPGGQAIASQTLAYNDVPTGESGSRGVEVTLTITYQFWYAGQWVQTAVTPTIYLYPQAYPAATPAPAFHTPYLKINTPVLNVRQGPGTNYPILGPAYQDSQFNITGKKMADNVDWWQIDFSGRTGWVSAYYVVAYGGEYVSPVATIPPTPPSTPPSTPPPTPAPDPNPVGMHEDPSAALPARADPAPASGPTPQFVNLPGSAGGIQTAPMGEAVATTANSGTEGPLVVIERYQTHPDRVVEGQPFSLEIVLRNAGQIPARQVVVSWRNDSIVPLGAGATRLQGDLAPGATTVISGQFLQTVQAEGGLVHLPLDFAYHDDNGQTYTRAEEIVLLTDSAAVIADAGPRSSGGARPLWLRIISGFLGLGAERK